MPDRFPEAFRRFEEDVAVSQFESCRQLESAFAYWSGSSRWKPTYKQNYSLRQEARRRGIPLDGFRKTRSHFFSPKMSWKCDAIIVRGKTQLRYRDVRTGRFIKKP